MTKAAGAGAAPATAERITIRLNGEPRVATRGPVLHLLHTLDLDPRMVVVELNRTIVRRQALQETLIHEGDEIELVHFVGGG